MRDQFDDALALAVRDTEEEIFNEASGREAPTPDLNRDVEQVEGWDGRPLSNEEQFARLAGVGLDGITDRPLETTEEVNEFQRMQKRTGDLEAENAELRARFDPDMRAARDAEQDRRRMKLMEAAIDNPDGLLNDISTLNNSRMQLDATRVEHSLQGAAHEHGDRFQSAYERLQAVGRQEKQQFGSSPTVTRIWGHNDPGRALLNWADSGMLPDPRVAGAPFMPGRQSAAPLRSSPERDGWDAAGSSDWAKQEEAIWNDVRRG